ncbi:MAG: hypothetical protein Q8L64_02035 [bacterium]|nr:hypothetical protein [bacterium]
MEVKSDPKLWTTVMILVAVIGCIGVLGAAFINALPDILHPSLTPSISTTIAVINTQGANIVQPTAAISETPIPVLSMPSITPQAAIPPTLPVQNYSYGVIGQGQQQTTLTSPGVCALYFYPFGGKEKTFVFKSESQVWVQNYNGTLSCWQTTPSLADVGTNHPFASSDEVQQAGVVFSGQISYIDPSTLK